MKLPDVVSAGEWEAASAELRAKEKEATRARDALAAERRRSPMMRVEHDCAFEGAGGEASLADLFEGRRQLITHHFMHEPGAEGWPEAACEGCTMFVDNLGHPAHLRARDTSIALVSRGPLERLLPYRERMGWPIPWYSIAGRDFSATSESKGASG